MNKSNFYKKAIISITGATLLSACLNQTSIKFLNNTSTEVRAAKKVKKAKITGANSAVYRQKNKKMVKTKKTIILGKKVRVSGQKTYKGKLYYKIGKNQYIKAANVDGKPRKVAKTTVLYTRNGKAIKNTKIIKGQKIKVYGAIVIIKGQKYYSTLFGYIKANTLAKKKPVVNPNGNNGNTQKPENNKPGNTNPSDNTNKPMTPTTPGSNHPTYPSAELQAAQAAAVKAVQEAAQNAKNAITASSSMTDDEKTAANGRVDTAAKTALGNDQDGKSGAIHDATTMEAVNQAKTDALTTINAEESNAKARK